MVIPEKTKKIAIHTFTGRGEHDQITNWVYIRDVVATGFSGYYLQSTAIVSNLKQANFFYSNERPPAFQGQAASGEKVQFLDPNDLPESILKDSTNLESLYE